MNTEPNTTRCIHPERVVAMWDAVEELVKRVLAVEMATDTNLHGELAKLDDARDASNSAMFTVHVGERCECSECHFLRDSCSMSGRVGIFMVWCDIAYGCAGWSDHLRSSEPIDWSVDEVLRTIATARLRIENWGT